MKLSIVDNEVTLSVSLIELTILINFKRYFPLQGYSQAISNELIDFNCRFDNICTDSRSGIFSTFTNMVGTIFSSDGSGIDISTIIGKKQSFHNIKTALIAFYEAVLLNRNFISLLTTVCNLVIINLNLVLKISFNLFVAITRNGFNC